MTCDKAITIYQGADFSQTWRWGTSPLIYKNVTGVPILTPLTLTVPTHGALDGWSIAMTDLSGLDNLSADEWPPVDDDDFYQATVVDADTLQFNTLDGARFGTAYIGGGQIAYYTPIDLTGATGVLNIYPYPQTVQNPQTVAVGSVAFNNTLKTISASLTAAQTATLTSRQYIYYLVVTVGGVVTVIDSGVINSKALGSTP